MNIRTTITSGIGLIFFLLSSCDKVKEAIRVNVPVTMNVDMIIPPVSETGSNIVLKETTTEINIDQLIKDANSELGAENIRSVSVESVSLSINEDSQFDPDNLTALHSASIALSSGVKAEWEKIAEVNDPADPYQTDIPVIAADLKPYFNTDAFNYRLEIVASRQTTHELHATARIKFIIKAGL